MTDPEKIGILSAKVGELERRAGEHDRDLKGQEEQRVRDMVAIDKRFEPIEDFFSTLRVLGGWAAPALRWLGPVILAVLSALLGVWATLRTQAGG